MRDRNTRSNGTLVILSAAKNPKDRTNKEILRHFIPQNDSMVNKKLDRKIEIHDPTVRWSF